LIINYNATIAAAGDNEVATKERPDYGSYWITALLPLSTLWLLNMQPITCHMISFATEGVMLWG